MCSSAVPSEQPRVNVGFSEWREIVDLAVNLAEADNVLEGEATLSVCVYSHFNAGNYL